MPDETDTGIRPALPPPQSMLPVGYIGDFGAKIKGARKDLSGNVTREDIESMTPEERIKLIVKNTVWPPPDYGKMVSDGDCTQKAALMVAMVRKSFPSGPVYGASATNEEKTRAAHAYNTLLNAAMAVCAKKRTEQELAESVLTHPAAAQHLVRLAKRPASGGRYDTYAATPSDQFGQSVNDAFRGDRGVARDILFALRCVAEGALDRTAINVLRHNPTWPAHKSREEIWMRTNHVSAVEVPGGWAAAYYGRISINPGDRDRLADLGFKEAAGKIYGSKQEAEAALTIIVKAKFEAKLAGAAAAREAKKERAEGKSVGASGPMVDRVGRAWRKGRQAAGEDYLTTFGLRGGQWGNYVPQKMRPELLNKGFDSLCDLAEALELPNAAISWGGRLAIAFGARGRGGKEAAHYEPMQTVMNLTKLSGAGCVAHEVGHSLDHFLGTKATEMGLKAWSRDPKQVDLLTNLQMTPAGDLTAMSGQEKLLRDLHARFDSIWLNSDPLTKPDIMEMAESWRSKAMSLMMAQVSKWESIMQQPSVSPDELQRFTDLAAKVRNPTKGDEMTSYTDGIVGMVHLPTIQHSPYSYGLGEALTGVRSALTSYQEKHALPEDHQEIGRPRKTEYAKACERVDGAGKPYYGQRAEMFARTFEALVVDAMQEKGSHNYFLVDGASGECFPQGRERRKFNKTIAPLIARLPELMPELTVVPPLLAGWRTPVRKERGLVAPDQMPLF